MRVNQIPKIPWVIYVIILAMVVVGGYVLTSQAVQGIGFPLDDAWIHQTYARNLASLGEWSFVPGQTSGGSTAPFWSMLLSLGYVLRLAPYIWTYGLGTIFLALLAFFGEKWFRTAEEKFTQTIPWAGLFLAGEWHLGWAAASGMETILFGLIILCVFYLLSAHKKAWLIGGLIGLAVWVRPDGVTLLGPAVFQIWLEADSGRERFKKSLAIFVPFLIGGAAFLAFNQAVYGAWLPNTFYAKQAEYAISQQIPILDRAFALYSLPLIGAGIFLLPAFLYFIWKAVRERNWNIIGAFLWWFGYTLIYVLRLPVTYQHGRYLIPAMPVYFVLGLLGMAQICRSLRSRAADRNALRLEDRIRRTIPIAWTGGVGLLWVVMAVVGAASFAQDVAIIQTEMVASSRWIAENTPQNSLIAAHDIGALGYYGNRNILDLAGLVSPSVIPIIRDESALKVFLDQNKADYLMTFPDWYPSLVKEGTPVFSTYAPYSPAAGGENMTVYKWR